MRHQSISDMAVRLPSAPPRAVLERWRTPEQHSRRRAQIPSRPDSRRQDGRHRAQRARLPEPLSWTDGAGANPEAGAEQPGGEQC